MIDEQAKTDYSNKLKHLLATPSDTRTYFEEYKSEHNDASFDEYTKSLEDLVDRLQEDKFKDKKSFCQEAQKLHLSTNQFDC